MKKFFLIFIAAAAVLIIAGCVSTPQSQPRSAELPVITVVNDTGAICYYLFLSPVTTESWEEDVLGEDVMPSGISIKVTLAYPLSQENRYDFRMIDRDGNNYIKWNVLLRENAKIVFTSQDIQESSN